MHFGKMLFSGAALLVLAAPVSARVIAAKERAETRELNRQQAQMAQQQMQPQTAPRFTDASAAGDNAPPAAAPTAPVQTAAIGAPQPQAAPQAQATAVANPAPDTAASPMVALDSLTNPPSAVATANVVDAKGSSVGMVQALVVDAGGKPVRVDVSLMGTDTVVAMAASQFHYDRARNMLRAALDARQIVQEPRAPRG